MAETTARLRSDLEMRRESPDPNAAAVLKDPVTGRFYRFAAVQAAVLQRLDGNQELSAIAAEVSDHFKIEVPQSQIADFVTKLRELLLIDHPTVWSKLDQVQRSRGRFFGALLSIKIHAFNPDNLLDKMAQRLRFCFSYGFRILAGISIGVGLILSILNWESMYLSLGTLVSLYSIPSVLVVAFCVMTIHEFAHGLTLKHYGGKVEEMGLLILYLIPAFYCNVNDAWMLDKRSRIRVTLAGGMAQLVLWSWATILWRLLAPETSGSQICLITIAFAGIQTLFNFNPLIKLDGYYLLSDWLEIPNLRARSFRYLRSRLSDWVSGPKIAAGEGPKKRERMIYLLYGTTSALFSFGLLFFALQHLAGLLIEEFQGWGIIMILSTSLLALPVARKNTLPTTVKVRITASRRMKRAPYAILALALVVGAGFFPWELKVSGDFTILPTKKVSVSPDVEGTLKMIAADEGHRTQAGDILATIENLDLSNSYEETRGELQAQRAALDLLLAGSRPEEIERARRLIETKKAELYNSGRVDQERKMLLETIDKKQAELQNAQSNYERSVRLLKDGLVAKNEADRERTAYQVQQKELSEAQGQLQVLEERTDNASQIKAKELAQTESELKILMAGSRKESINAVEAQVAKLEEKLKILAQQLEYLQIRSPMAGVVTTPHLKERIGEYLKKGERFCEIVSEGTVLVEMPVPEKEIADVQLGFPIMLKVRGYPRSSFSATIKAIAPIAVNQDSQRTVMVQGELPNSDGQLKSGMTGVGKILCGKKPVAELLTRRAIRWLRTEFWEYLP